MSTSGISLVTGGSGYIGRHLVAALTTLGRPVRVLDIDTGMDAFGPEVELWQGSILDSILVEQAMEGVSDVYHLAAIPHLWCLNQRDFHRVNVEGTKIMLNAAKSRNLRKFVHTSSETVLRGYRDKTTKVITENSPVPGLHDLAGPYSRSKLLADLAVLDAVKEGLPAVIVYPTVPVGPGDINMTAPTRMIRDFINGSSKAYLNCYLNLIPVKEVAAGLVLAADRGVVGERYILGNDNLQMPQILKIIEDISKKKMPKTSIPYFVAYTSAYVLELMANNITHSIPMASVEGVRLAGARLIFDSSKARTKLEVPKYSVEKALEECIHWLFSNGYLK